MSYRMAWIVAAFIGAGALPAEAHHNRPAPVSLRERLPKMKERVAERVAERPAATPNMLPHPDAPASLIPVPPVPGVARPSDAGVGTPALPGDIAGSPGIANPVPLPHPGIEPRIGAGDALASPALGSPTPVGKERARIAREVAGRGPGLGLRPGIPKGLSAQPGRRPDAPPAFQTADTGAGAGEDAAIQAFTAQTNRAERGERGERGRRERGARRRNARPAPEPIATREQLPDVGF
jgi:hypothetical protein